MAGIFGLLLAASLASAALADEYDQPFVTLYTTKTEPAQEAEFEQYFVWKAVHARARFDEFQSRSELEYGITDDLQGSLYLSYDLSEAREHVPPGPLESEREVGVSGELIWRLLDVDSAPIGLAVYAEPAWSPVEHSIETKLLIQKNFFDGRLTTAFNVNVEDIWVRDAPGHFDEQSALELDLGASWNVAPGANFGVEVDNERAFAGEILGSAATQASSSVYLGPTFEFSRDPWSVTLGAEAQVPIATGPGATGGYASDAEHYRATLRFTTDL